MGEGESEGVHVLVAGGALGPTDGRRWATTARMRRPRVAAASVRDTGVIQAGEKRVADAWAPTTVPGLNTVNRVKNHSKK
jgi:hypothetical protein